MNLFTACSHKEWIVWTQQKHFYTNTNTDGIIKRLLATVKQSPNYMSQLEK